MNEYLEYGFSHDEFDASTECLRQHQWAQKPSLYWRQPVSFGPMPGPRQDFSGRSRRDSLIQSTCRTATIVFKTSATLLRSMLPSSAYSFTTRNTVVEASLRLQTLANLQWLGGTGYNLLGLYKHDVQYTSPSGEKTAGTYLPVMFENLADPIISGREELGFPKVYSEIDVQQVGDCCTATLSWRGAKWAEFKLPNLQDAPLTDEAFPVGGNVLVHKCIPGVGAQESISPDSNYAAVLRCSTGTTTKDVQKVVKARKTCGAAASIVFNAHEWQRLPTLHHIVERLAELPIIEVVGASIEDSTGVADFAGMEKLS